MTAFWMLFDGVIPNSTVGLVEALESTVGALLLAISGGVEIVFKGGGERIELGTCLIS